MKVRDSAMPEARYWEGLFDFTLVMERMHISSRQPQQIVEFGCGYGSFTCAAAPWAGELLALDIEPDMIRRTRLRCRLNGLTNVVTRQSDVMGGTLLPDGLADYVMLFNLLHGEEPGTIVAEARRILAPGGAVGIIHWNYDPATPRGPDMKIRPRPEQLADLVVACGLRVGARINLPPYHYGFVAEAL